MDNVISRLVSLRDLLAPLIPMVQPLIPTAVHQELADVLDGLDNLIADLNDEAEDMESESAAEDVEIEYW